MEEKSKKITNLKKSLENQKEKAEMLQKIVNKYFSESQLRRIKDKNSRAPWDQKDIVNSISLFTLSKKSYRYVRSSLEIPLPCETTMKKHIRQCEIGSGFLETSLNLLEKKIKDLKPRDKVFSIMFDEVQLNAEYALNFSKDIIHPPYSKAQVVMVRSIFGGNIKIPVYFGFDQWMSPALFDSIIKRLTEIGVRIKTCVCDQGGTNVKFYNELKVSYQEGHNFIQNKYRQNDKIYMLYDIPHAVKNIQTHVLNQGLILPSGHILNKEAYLELLEMDTYSPYKICPKLTHQHINVSFIIIQFKYFLII